MRRKRQTKKRANKNGKILCSGGEENERQMANNVNCEEMIFVIRNLVDVDDVSPATTPKISFDVG